MQTHKNVQGIVIVNNEGAIIRSTYTTERKEEGTLSTIFQATPWPASSRNWSPKARTQSATWMPTMTSNS